MNVTGKGTARRIQSLISVEVEVENQLVSLPIPLRPKIPNKNMAKEKRISKAKFLSVKCLMRQTNFINFVLG